MVKSKAVLVSVWLPSVSQSDHAASLAEMKRLASTLGFEVVQTITQKRSALAAGAVLGGGKLKTLALHTGGTGEVPSGAVRRVTKAQQRELSDADDPTHPEDDTLSDAEADGEPDRPSDVIANLVIVDNEISPSQIRNLEKATGVEVLDRSGVIIEIFHRHARTREARLQVELARLAYEAPRLREKPTRGDRQRAGSVGGSGESELELDRRRIRDRIAVLRRELEAVSLEQSTRRARRREENKVALVGYTNAGKSSLMRALTGSDVLDSRSTLRHPGNHGTHPGGRRTAAHFGIRYRGLHQKSSPRLGSVVPIDTRRSPRCFAITFCGRRVRPRLSRATASHPGGPSRHRCSKYPSTYRAQ